LWPSPTGRGHNLQKGMDSKPIEPPKSLGPAQGRIREFMDKQLAAQKSREAREGVTGRAMEPKGRASSRFTLEFKKMHPVSESDSEWVLRQVELVRVAKKD